MFPLAYNALQDPTWAAGYLPWIILAILFLAWSGLAIWLAVLRSAAGDWADRYEQLCQSLRKLNKEINQLRGEIPADFGGPYTPLVREAGTQANQANADCNEARHLATVSDPAHLAASPFWQWLLCVPLIQEIRRRLALRTRLERAAELCRSARTSYEAGMDQVAAIKDLGPATRRQLNERQTRLQLLNAELEKLKPADLQDESQSLARLSGELEQAQQLLAASQLPGPGIARASHIVENAQGVLNDIAAVVEQHNQQRRLWSERIAVARRALQTLQQRIEEAARRYPLNSLQAGLPELHTTLAPLPEHVTQAHYGEVENGVKTYTRRFEDLQRRFEALQNRRAALEQTYTHLTALQDSLANWLAHIPPERYHMDVSRAHLERLRQQLPALRQALDQSEDLEELQAVDPGEAGFIEQARQEFDQRRSEYEKLTATGWDFQQGALLERCGKRSESLRTCHPSYRSRAAYDQLARLAGQLPAVRHTLSDPALLVNESALLQRLNNWRNYQKAFEQLKTCCDKADQVYEQMLAEKKKALGLLENEDFKACQQISREADTSHSQKAEVFCRRIQALNEQAHAEGSHYEQIQQDIHTLRQEISAELLAPYRAEQTRTEEDIRRLTPALSQQRLSLTNCRYEDMQTEIDTLSAQIQAWNTRTPRRDLPSLRTHRAHGRDLQKRGETLAERITTRDNRLREKREQAAQRLQTIKNQLFSLESQSSAHPELRRQIRDDQNSVRELEYAIRPRPQQPVDFEGAMSELERVIDEAQRIERQTRDWQASLR